MADALMFTMYGFLFAGPFLLAIAETVALQWRFQVPLWRSLFGMTLANFLLAGLFFATLRDSGTGFSLFGLQPDLDSIAGFLFLGVVLSVVGTFAVYLPFCHFIDSRRNFKNTLRMSAISTLVAMIVFGVGFARVTDLSVLNYTIDKSYVGILPPAKATLYFISDGQVMRGDLRRGDFSPVAAAPAQSQIRVDLHSGELWLTVGGLDVQKLDRPASAKTLKAEYNLDTNVQVNYQEHPEVRAEALVSLSTPFIRWAPGRENIYPTGEVIAGLGGRILFEEFGKKRIAFIAKGTSPLLILEN